MSKVDLKFNEGITDLLGPYAGPVEDVHAEVCGEGGNPSDTFQNFLEAVRGVDRSPMQALSAIVAGGGQNKYVVASVYRRFLDGGRNCPEGSAGLVRWKEMDGIEALDPKRLAIPDTAFFKEYKESISSIRSPEVLVSAWGNYIAAVFESIDLVRPEMENLAKQHEDGAQISNGEFRDALFPLINTFKASDAFAAKASFPASKSWDYHFVNTQRAKLANYMGGIIPYVDLFGSGMLGNLSDGRILNSVLNHLDALYEPFDHIHYSYAIDKGVIERIRMEAPSKDLKISPAEPIPLRKIIDEIIYEAGKVKGARIRIEWDEKARLINFTDETEGGSAFKAFADPNGEAGRRLSSVAEASKAGWPLSFSRNDSTGRMMKIGVFVFEAVAPEVGKEASDAEAGSNAQPSPEKRFGGVAKSGIKTVGDMSSELLYRSKELKAIWDNMSENQKRRALAELVLLAKEDGPYGLKSLDDAVLKGSFERAAAAGGVIQSTKPLGK